MGSIAGATTLKVALSNWKVTRVFAVIIVVALFAINALPRNVTLR